jgi:thiosulfate/3-mercaptopyruvate sulfurtransferase
MPEFPQEGAVRGGHIPGAASVPWAKAADEDGRFRSRAELEEIYRGQEALDPAEPVIVYCRIGERSSHTWFVLRYLLGFADVKNYDGSWTEWGNGVRLPVARGEERGEVPSR